VIGETGLSRLLARLDPILHDGVYVFATTLAATVPAGVTPVMTFTEDEATTLILRREEAERAGLEMTFPSAWITLRIHSSLEAIGMMAQDRS
jgi:hypothetical protein